MKLRLTAALAALTLAGLIEMTLPANACGCTVEAIAAANHYDQLPDYSVREVSDKYMLLTLKGKVLEVSGSDAYRDIVLEGQPDQKFILGWGILELFDGQLTSEEYYAVDAVIQANLRTTLDRVWVRVVNLEAGRSLIRELESSSN